MARVNVDSIAFSDGRFAVLAALMGSDDTDLAIGRMVRIWNQCYERETYVLTQSVIVALFRGNPDAPNWLVCAELAEPTDGGFRIRGTKGRIEYVSRKRLTARQNGTKGGRPRKTDVGCSKNQRGIQIETPPAPAPAPAPDTPQVIPPNPPAGGDSVHLNGSFAKTEEAIAAVSGLDLATAHRRIRAAAMKLEKATPPYTSADVEIFGTRFHELCGWARQRGHERPTPATIAAHIGLLRATQPAKPTKSKTDSVVDQTLARIRRERGEA